MRGRCKIRLPKFRTRVVAPIVALINAAAEVSHKPRQCRYLIYGKFSYGRRSDSTLAEFKRRLGFSQLDFPRYFVPLTMLGRIALRLRLHQGLTALLPSWLLEQGIAARARLVSLGGLACATPAAPPTRDDITPPPPSSSPTRIRGMEMPSAYSHTSNSAACR